MGEQFEKLYISIHSLRMEGDVQRSDHRRLKTCISIHSLRMEGDSLFMSRREYKTIFQSTPSAWRETSAVYVSSASIAFQSTPSAWRETHKTG